MKRIAKIAETVGVVVAAFILAFLVVFSTKGCSEPKIVKADTGEVIQESNKLKSREYDLSGTDYDLRVIDYSKGGVHYLIFSRGVDNIAVVNYTLDSLEVAFHVEYLDKPDSSQNTIFDHVRANGNH